MNIAIRLISLAARFGSARSGATTIEYCMLAVMIGLGLIGAATIWGEKASAMYENLAEKSVAAQSGS
jgi:Flp pilus assembly pilin Flp